MAASGARSVLGEGGPWVARVASVERMTPDLRRVVLVRENLAYVWYVTESYAKEHRIQPGEDAEVPPGANLVMATGSARGPKP